MVLVAVDPAARTYSWARFVLGVLVACGVGSAPLADADVLVLETPRDYAQFQAAHKDLDRLRFTLAKVRARAGGARVVTHYPSAWKGNVPKDVHHRRALKALSPIERRLLAGPDEPGYDHNVCDAVCLGLFGLGRVGRGGSRVASESPGTSRKARTPRGR